MEKGMTNQPKVKGLGDLVEWFLRKIGITEERIKNLLNIEECGCSTRKQRLNKFWSWGKKKKEDKPPSK